MTLTENFLPSKAERLVAGEALKGISHALARIPENAIETEIEIEETGDKIRLPVRSLALLERILETVKNGEMVTVTSLGAEVSTQAAAELLGVSRPYVVKLLEEGKMPYKKVGKHRRILVENVLAYKKEFKANQLKVITNLMAVDEANGVYDLQH